MSWPTILLLILAADGKPGLAQMDRLVVILIVRAEERDEEHRIGKTSFMASWEGRTSNGHD
jgi:hypothetical protein